jgi:hypothetical protein
MWIDFLMRLLVAFLTWFSRLIAIVLFVTVWGACVWDSDATVYVPETIDVRALQTPYLGLLAGATSLVVSDRPNHLHGSTLFIAAMVFFAPVWYTSRLMSAAFTIFGIVVYGAGFRLFENAFEITKKTDAAKAKSVEQAYNLIGGVTNSCVLFFLLPTLLPPAALFNTSILLGILLKIVFSALLLPIALDPILVLVPGYGLPLLM